MCNTELVLAAVLTVSVVMLQAAAGCGGESAPPVTGSNPIVLMETSEGTVKIELWADRAPKTVENFLGYADEGFYDGTIFHRVIAGFMIQGGGFKPGMVPKTPHARIRNEASADLKNKRGTIAMARTSQVHSATCQFFVNVEDNPPLDHYDNTDAAFGYAVFGEVIEGMDVVDCIALTDTGTVGDFKDVPIAPVTIESVRRVGQ